MSTDRCKAAPYTTVLRIHGSLHCACGTSFRGNMSLEAWCEVIEKWNQSHAGEGHGPANARQAKAVRKERKSA